MKQKEQWSLVISPKDRWFELNLREVWQYRDLLFLLVWRDFVALYKQTILGPLWFFIQPIFATIIFTIVFSGIANISTDGLPPILFYMSGIIGWNYFADCLTKTSATFTSNAHIFGKVYFPRLIVPLSIVVSNLLKFGVQFLLFFCFMLYFILQGEQVVPNEYMLLTPVLLLLMAGQGLGFGIVISSLTTKYRDLQYLVTFGVQLFMYLTPIVYPSSELDGSKYADLMKFNPIAPIIETFRYAFTGAGAHIDKVTQLTSFDLSPLLYSFGFTSVLLFLGLIIFHRVEKNFMDTV